MITGLIPVKYNISRRIFVMVLLFAFGGIPLSAQVPDSVRSLRRDSPEIPVKKPGERTNPVPDTTFREIPDEVRSAFMQDTIPLRDSSKLQNDSIPRKEELEEGHSPRKAMIYSIVLPGLGQAYNKKYWKIPIVYGALGGAAYAIYFNTRKYREVSDLYADDPTGYERAFKYWRRNMELSYIAIVLVDALNVIDAYVDAHLYYWEVDPDLTLRMEPAIQPMINPGGSLVNNYGFRCTLTF